MYKKTAANRADWKKVFKLDVTGDFGVEVSKVECLRQSPAVYVLSVSKGGLQKEGDRLFRSVYCDRTRKTKREEI